MFFFNPPIHLYDTLDPPLYLLILLCWAELGSSLRHLNTDAQIQISACERGVYTAMIVNNGAIHLPVCKHLG